MTLKEMEDKIWQAAANANSKLSRISLSNDEMEIAYRSQHYWENNIFNTPYGWVILEYLK